MNAGIYSDVSNAERQQWLAERRKGIGGSDAAKVLGISKWGGPFTVWNDKVNGISPEVNSEAVHWGTVLEEVVAREFVEQTGMKVRRRNSITAHKSIPFILANIDREIIGQRVGLECKTTAAWRADDWKNDELPDEYYTQVQHYCFVMDWEGCWIACLIGGQKFVYKYIPRNEDFISQMVEIEREFWESYVVPGIPPALSIFDDVSHIEQSSEDMLEPTEQDKEYAARLSDIRSRLDDLESEKKTLEVYFKGRIMDNAGMNGVATWKKSKDSQITDWKAVAAELNPSVELIKKHTSIKEGSRRFLVKFN